MAKKIVVTEAKYPDLSRYEDLDHAQRRMHAGDREVPQSKVGKRQRIDEEPTPRFKLIV